MIEPKAIENAHRLIHTSSRVLTDADIDLSAQQYTVMAIVGETGRAAMADMARRLFVAPTVVTGIVDRLEDRGFVERRFDRSDRRRNWVHLTSRGHQALTSATEALERHAA